MRMFKIRLSSFGFVLLAAVASTLGCGPASGPKLAPVSGKVLLDGAPLKSGTINLVADESKGAKQTGSSSGSIGPDGTFKITTDGKDGAPLGWYKVVVVTMVPGGMGDTGPLNTQPQANSRPTYSDQAKTLLSFEVVDNPKPGAYDLTLSK
jgi:hypothetical protein